MEYGKHVAWLDGRDYWNCDCDAIYVNNCKAVATWIKEHGDVWDEPFEHGTEFHDEEGCTMYHITDFMDIDVTVIGENEVWFIS